MEDLCRLCLSVCSEQIHNLYENSELVTKIATCLQLEILKVDSLPNQICYGCNDKVDQIHLFLKSVIENQNVLYCHLKSGKNCLDHFYSSLKTVKDEAEDISPKLKEEDTTQISNEIEIKYDAAVITNEIEIKHETTEIINETQEEHKSNDNNQEADIGFSSDDEITLISLKSEKENTDNNLKVNDKRNKNKKIIKKKITSQKKSDPKETKENIQLHSTNNSTQNIEWKCLMCFKIFEARLKLSKHYRNAHKPDNPPTCNIKKYSTVQEDGDTKLKCGYCEKIYHNKNQVQRHIQYVHQERRPYNCSLCGRTYKLISEIVGHLRAHDGPKLFCSYHCGYSSVYVAALKIHEKNHRNESSKYKCEKCGKGFEVRTWYEDHQNIHTGAKPFACNICNYAFSFRKYLAKHQREMHPVSEPPLDKAMYICIHCSMPCESKTALKTHLSKKHGIGGKKTYLCDLCGKSFKRSSNLIGHKKHHMGIRNHTCSICKKSFVKLNGLKRHERTHTGQKRLACDTCGKRYESKDALVKHILRYHSLSASNCPKMNPNK